MNIDHGLNSYCCPYSICFCVFTVLPCNIIEPEKQTYKQTKWSMPTLTAIALLRHFCVIGFICYCNTIT